MEKDLRDFVTLQRGRRIQLKQDFMDKLKWEEGDQLLLETYKGRLFVENLSKGLLPLGERMK